MSWSLCLCGASAYFAAAVDERACSSIGWSESMSAENIPYCFVGLCSLLNFRDPTFRSHSKGVLCFFVYVGWGLVMVVIATMSTFLKFGCLSEFFSVCLGSG